MTDTAHCGTCTCRPCVGTARIEVESDRDDRGFIARLPGAPRRAALVCTCGHLRRGVLDAMEDAFYAHTGRYPQPSSVGAWVPC